MDNFKIIVDNFLFLILLKGIKDLNVHKNTFTFVKINIKVNVDMKVIGE